MVIDSSDAKIFFALCFSLKKDLPVNSKGEDLSAATEYSVTLGLTSIISVVLILFIWGISLP